MTRVDETTQQASAWLAEFATPAALVAAARELHGRRGVTLQAYTPFPVDELDELGLPGGRRIALTVLLAALAGAVLGYGVQYWTAVIDYPYLVGGKPMHAWPAFIPVTFELAVLFGAFAGFLAIIWGCGLPRPHHPLFDVQAFSLASRDRFFLLVAGADDQALAAVRDQLQGMQPQGLWPVRSTGGDDA